MCWELSREAGDLGFEPFTEKRKQGLSDAGGGGVLLTFQLLHRKMLIFLLALGKG